MAEANMTGIQIADRLGCSKESVYAAHHRWDLGLATPDIRMKMNWDDPVMRRRMIDGMRRSWKEIKSRPYREAGLRRWANVTPEEKAIAVAHLREAVDKRWQREREENIDLIVGALRSGEATWLDLASALKLSRHQVYRKLQHAREAGLVERGLKPRHWRLTKSQQR